jgi:radical SAM superfamily enzyme YgiQ (UPF0313 family)
VVEAKTLDYRNVLLVRIHPRVLDILPRNMPVGLMALAAWVRERRPGFRFRILDQSIDPNAAEAAVIDAVVTDRVGVLGLSAMTCGSRRAAELARAVKARSPGTIVVMGGPHPSNDPDGAMRESAIDYAIAGEGEIPFEKLLVRIADGGDPAEVPGVFSRRGDVVTQCAPGELVQDLDELPHPAYDLIDPRPFWRHQGFTLMGRRPYMPLFTSRGCPYQCTYCHKIFGARFRTRSPGRVLDMMEEIARRHGVREFEILDDAFNIREDRAMAILDGVQARVPGARLLFPNGLRTDLMSHAFIDALARAGTQYVSFAVESASPRIQALVRKGLDLDRVKDNIDYASRRGIFCNGFFMVGFPGETAQELRATVDWACASRLHTATFFALTPQPGTPIWRELDPAQRQALLAIDDDHRQYTMLATNLTAMPDGAVLKALRRAFLRFYANPLRVVRILRAHPRRFQALALGVRQFLRRLVSIRFGRIRRRDASPSTSCGCA